MADIKVYGTLRTMATDGIVATADQLKDTNVGKFQEVINQELAGGMEGKQDTIEDLEQIRSLSNSAVQPSVLQAAIADFITKSVDDLVNYYKKSETYTKAEVNGLIGAIKQFTYRVASSLPTASESTMYIIYLIPSSNASTQNVKDEFITIQDGSSYSWEQIGSTKIDLSGYSTTEEMNAAITSALNTALSDYYDKAGVDELLSNYAHKDGFYETLGAGTALNLQGNTSKDATFTYRTAGGTEDIASGLATIHSIKGNTVVWNQKVSNGNFADGTTNWTTSYVTDVQVNNNIISMKATSSTIAIVGIRQYQALTKNHKYFINFNWKVDKGDESSSQTKIKIIPNLYANSEHNISNLASKTINYNTWDCNKVIYDYGLDNYTYQLRLFLSYGSSSTTGIKVDDIIYFKNIFIIDLTLMFGAGNEPLTVEEFEEWLTNNVGYQDYYEYSEPTMLSADANSLETVGFNQWDGTYSRDNSWYNGNTDTVGADSNYAISNFISVFPNTEYFIKGTQGANVGMAFFDKDKVNLKQSVTYNNRTSFTFTTPTNAAYLKFSYAKSAANQTNLNLSWSGIRNGEYEEYWKRTYPINVKQLTSNGTVIFPNGMNRVGNVYDEIVSVDGVTKAIKRIGSVDLGTMSWILNTTHTENTFMIEKSITDKKLGIKNLICSKYPVTTKANWASLQDKEICGYVSQAKAVVRDSAYTDAATFKAAMDGVMLYYELTTPIEYEIDNFEMPLAYKVDDFGTEETKKDTFSLSPTFAITYGVNAVDTLRRLPTNYISKESMQNFLSALGVQMGGTWSMTLDNNEYKFSFVANPEATTNDDGV